ncbi:ArsI/CadI family heavy metal resistance metalloenzyme [Nocardioides sp. MH1]|uniref:ArsI/CadI family heavy metal resistance metalloenzyme n=1 Tax=Nocardioides sp. MH1 TaxID=3242490 RepID=UPI003521B7A0
MSRIQLALNVDDLDAAVAFYSTLFDTTPAKTKPGYANFAVTEPPLKLVLIENPGHGGSLNHLGVEVDDVDRVDAELARLTAAGFASTEERDTTCCYAKQDKFWVENTPDQERWEVYTVLEHSETFRGRPEDEAGRCCGQESTADLRPTEAACC